MPSYKDQLYGYYYDEMSLSHHGVLGQKWGVRRYQNPDGTRTTAGKKHEQALNSSESGSSSKSGRIHNYGTEIGARSNIKAAYKQAKRDANKKDYARTLKTDKKWDKETIAIKNAYKSGKISKRERDEAFEKSGRKAMNEYIDSAKQYKKDVNTAKAQYHENRARMFENRANLSTKESKNNILLRGLNNDRLGKANTERLKANVSMAKASGDKEAISKAKAALNRSNALNFTFGRANVAAYNKYKNAGENTVKAILKAGTVG